MTDIFIERRLTLQNSGEVCVRLFRPTLDDVDYRCDVHIDWPDRQQRLHVFGIDAVQALFLAMQCAHAELLASPEHGSRTLTWLGGYDFGLPLVGALTSSGHGGTYAK
ncbi:DUF6968 family protein [Dyella tabacisoli]|uniref:DUF6968 domain-containing protein n=1 Tax=Dyella tabacisoli TaxID=2282381 RepID=A0A369UPA2_9GAMM|nr:hypothetical protein [Dyella tabacisoli]RDD81548.1 hypothetical protein DVJ77_10235 [Dyella tabacisoli]